MAFLRSTPQEDVQAVITQTGENAKQAMLWFAVIGVIVFIILFAGKNHWTWIPASPIRCIPVCPE